MMDFQIISLTAELGHFESFIRLNRTYYSPQHPIHTAEFLKWFYLDNPAGPATLIVAREDDLWIGVLALIPIFLKHSSLQQKACFCVNVLTHPEHRKKRLFIKMITQTSNLLSKEGIWLLGHPNANAVPSWKRMKMGFREPLHLYLAKPRMPFSPVRVRTINSLEDLKEIPSEFWDQVNIRADVHVDYSPEFLTWRFLNSPHRKYHMAGVYSHGSLEGLRITRRYKGPVDLLVDHIGPLSTLGGIVSSVQKPTLVMHPISSKVGKLATSRCWKLPLKREFPFFVTTWGQDSVLDMDGITLAASDF